MFFAKGDIVRPKDSNSILEISRIEVYMAWLAPESHHQYLSLIVEHPGGLREAIVRPAAMFELAPRESSEKAVEADEQGIGDEENSRDSEAILNLRVD
jgi:hypothetical protein